MPETVLLTRVFDAPRDRVFRAWTDPDHVAAWFGPPGMDVARDSVDIDLRVGGQYALTMAGPRGAHRLVYEIVELDAPALLVLRADPIPEAGMLEPSYVRIELHDHGDRTRMTFSDGPFPPGGAERAEAGWTAAFAQLGLSVR